MLGRPKKPLDMCVPRGLESNDLSLGGITFEVQFLQTVEHKVLSCVAWNKRSSVQFLTKFLVLHKYTNI